MTGETAALGARYSHASGLDPAVTERSVTAQIANIALHPTIRRRWCLSMMGAGLLTFVLMVSIGWLFVAGIGIWHLQIPVTWGLAISNYVWWIGMGHAGTLISALLLIMNKGWRNSLNRFAEAMTVFAVLNASIYPILHLGRPSFFYYLIPYPGTLGVWPQFRSPLMWDVFAVGSYLIVSILFWYIGLVPDLAVLRDRAHGRFAQVAYGLLSLGWRGAARHWIRWRIAYWTVAGLAVPLVVSVHSGVSMLFAVGLEPGWHSTLLPPFFVFGAVFEGFAVVTLIALSLRRAFGLQDLVTARHMELLARLVLATGLATIYGYLFEAFGAWYSGQPYERALAVYRLLGPYSWAYWATLACNALSLQLLWSARLRRNLWVLGAVAALVTVGMWCERFMIVIPSLAHDFLPSSWRSYAPSVWEWMTFAGTIGLFLLLFLLFVRFLPVISMFEVKEILHAEREPRAVA